LVELLLEKSYEIPASGGAHRRSTPNASIIFIEIRTCPIRAFFCITAISRTRPISFALCKR
jgi:hypothetical protein